MSTSYEASCSHQNDAAASHLTGFLNGTAVFSGSE